MKISLSSLTKPKLQRKKLPGEPRPFKPKVAPESSFPPRHDIRAVGPDAVEQARKEKRLRYLLDQHSIPDTAGLVLDLLSWERS